MSGRDALEGREEEWQETLLFVQEAFDLSGTLVLSAKIPVFSPATPDTPWRSMEDFVPVGVWRYAKDKAGWQVGLHVHDFEGRLELLDSWEPNARDRIVLRALGKTEELRDPFIVDFPSAHVVAACFKQSGGKIVCVELKDTQDVRLVTSENLVPFEVMLVAANRDREEKRLSSRVDLYADVEAKPYADDDAEPTPSPLGR